MKWKSGLITLSVNKEIFEVAVKPNDTLLEVLREKCDLVGAKEGCGLGECGACTVLRDGRPILSCLSLAVDAAGSEITTIEGLAEGDCPPPPAGVLYRTRGGPVRLLHPGHDSHGRGIVIPAAMSG